MKLFVVFFSFFYMFVFGISKLEASGSEIYNNYCITCHSPQMSEIFSSPTVHDQKAWGERKKAAFDKVMEKDNNIINLSEIEKDNVILNFLLASATNGTDNGMPPKGTCMECTDEDLKSAILFMMSSK